MIVNEGRVLEMLWQEFAILRERVESSMFLI